VKKGEVESKILSALLTGVNCAYPYAKGLSESQHEMKVRCCDIVCL